MTADFKINRVDRYINGTDTSPSHEFIPSSCQIVKIQVGDCESSIDLKAFHFYPVPQENKRAAYLNYSFRVQNFHANDKVQIFWNDKPHEIKQNEDNIIFKVDNLNFQFFYNLTIE